ncbi:ornithine cyclodeaminase family protein [Pararhodobacter zhoushanensis]|uniref:Ornithine cyclodeaminase n=1 Tax=Pararhodobacter zhoushanensis TaxID=2479545 RepID=A0ABT3H324_9RHOB|nr:ornithine cyclodeaminase [Pararhodobacter zhoushanensis]MCW1934179.1 ornithine cyclodeaminase [Pararhodobacter zhoushanensis]
MIPVLTLEAVEPLLDWMALGDAILDAHRRAPAQIKDVLMERGADRLLSRAAWIDGMGLGVKSVSVFPGNAAKGLPSVQGAMLVFDDQTGAIEAVIDNALITKWKTAGDSLLGARLLARPDAQSLLIVGAGTVAASLIEAYRAWKPDLAITLWSRRPEPAQALAARFRAVRTTTDLPAAVAAADIVSTCTMATDPLIHGAWLRPGQHLDLIGAYTPTMREADDEALQRGRLFVDSRATTLGHIGELMIPLASGAIKDSDVLGDFHDLSTGSVGRQSPQDITVFKNGGGAHLDLMTARMILSRWRDAQM